MAAIDLNDVCVEIDRRYGGPDIRGRSGGPGPLMIECPTTEIRLAFRPGVDPTISQPNNWAFLTHPVTMKLPIVKDAFFYNIEISAGKESIHFRSVKVTDFTNHTDRVPSFYSAVLESPAFRSLYELSRDFN